VAGAWLGLRGVRMTAIVLPLGRNCHLGAALSHFGHHESSLFRWADVSLARVVAFLEGEAAFAGYTAFRFQGASLGTLDYAEMRARLPEVSENAKVNTIVYDADGVSYVHGVQLTLAEAAASRIERIRAANVEKIDYLSRKLRTELSAAASVVAVRLEWAAVSEPQLFAGLGAILRRLNPAAALHVVAPAGGIEGQREGVAYVGLQSTLPPPSDIMNVAPTAAEWMSLLTNWGVPRVGAEKPYLFDI
jgi:hypothetical protein